MPSCIRFSIKFNDIRLYARTYHSFLMGALITYSTVLQTKLKKKLFIDFQRIVDFQYLELSFYLFSVFEEVMLPLIEMKNYSHYIVTYLVNLVNRFNDVPLTKEQYLLIMDIIFTTKKNFTAELTQSLLKIVPKLKVLLFTNNSDKYSSFVETFLRKLSANNIVGKYKNELCNVIVMCLQKNQMSFVAWNNCYVKNISSSATVLDYIGRFVRVCKKLRKIVTISSRSLEWSPKNGW